MITTTLAGGLGNQMFMYAFARSLALSNNTTYAFDIESGFSNDITFKRKLELSYFNLSLPKTKLKACSIGVRRIDNAIKKISRRLSINILDPSYLFIAEDKNLHYQPELFQLNNTNIYLEGYWQSPKYFERFQDIIRDDFCITTQLSPEIHNELDIWRSYNRPLVFVGVRRYQECSRKDVTWGVCDSDFYMAAMQLVRERIESPLFIVFSQDLQWCKQNFHSEDVIYSSIKKGPDATISDLFLMTGCDHAIISNSSYYWWGAWLQNNPDHTVVASKNFMNKDFSCDNWIVL